MDSTSSTTASAFAAATRFTYTSPKTVASPTQSTDTTSVTNSSAGVWTGITLLENDAGNDSNLLNMMSSFETVGQKLSIFV